ncbi:Ig-like domain repeat protein [Nocardioides deserti]|uniref:Ig-like domain repeat protein n=1 Tax=Nocardioides deserti TaxID=1588644 RepID=A0ABR6UB80_9ACTN|nr:Ig-like domain repeat protein [Nocardioides deserti]MBC2961224.1 Ig-like domain repeat protein [Nocardioides deserti]
MQINRFARRLAVATTSVAVAGTALVGATATSANAAEATNAYTCSIPGVFTGTFDITVLGGLPESFLAGAAVPDALASNLAVQAVAQIDQATYGTLELFQINAASADDFAFTLGSASVPAPVTGPITETETGGEWKPSGTVKAFTTPGAGTYEVSLPQSFTLTGKNGDTKVADVPCTLAEGETAGSLGSITLTKQASTVAAKNVTVKKGKKATVKVTVGTDSVTKSGKVVATKGKKNLGSAKVKNGKATLKLAKLPVGKHKVVVKFTGNQSVKGSSKTITVTVKKK